MFKSLDYYCNFYTNMALNTVQYATLGVRAARVQYATLGVRAARVRQSISHACSGTTIVLCLVAIIKS